MEDATLYEVQVGEAPLYVLNGGRSATLCVKRWEKRHFMS